MCMCKARQVLPTTRTGLGLAQATGTVNVSVPCAVNSHEEHEEARGKASLLTWPVKVSRLRAIYPLGHHHSVLSSSV